MSSENEACRTLSPLAQGQFFEAIGKLIGLRNPRAFQKDRNDADAALQRGLNLDAHEVSGTVQASIAVLVTRIEPAKTNNRKEHVTLGDFLVDCFDEVGAKRNGVDVHKQEIFAELPLQSVVYPTGVASTVVAPITNE